MNEFRNSDLPYVDNLEDLLAMKERGQHSHVRVHEKLFALASRKPTGMASVEDVERINDELGLAVALLEYDSSPCTKCGHEITGFDFMKSAVAAHGARLLSNEKMYGFMLRVSEEPLMISCPSCAMENAAGNYVDHHQHGATHTCFAYGCSRITEDLRKIQRMMLSGSRAYKKRISAIAD